jgi:hypothetical protein
MTREQLRAALDSVTVVDAQPPERYGQRHLPGALDLVAKDSEDHVRGALPAGRGRWTRGEETVELEPEGMLVVPPGFRNVGDVPLLVVSVHERGTCARRGWAKTRPEKEWESRPVSRKPKT